MPMERTVTIPPADYTPAGTPFVNEFMIGARQDSGGVFRRMLLRLFNTSAPSTIAIYRAVSGLTALSDQLRAEGEVFFNDAVPVLLDPEPDFHIVIEVPFALSRTESLYLYLEATAPDILVNGSCMMVFN